MTKLQERLTHSLEVRHERLLRENTEHLRTGRFKEYTKNCLRIARIREELTRRENLRHRKDWEVYV